LPTAAAETGDEDDGAAAFGVGIKKAVIIFVA
jgi:hypothetical protein